MFQVLGLCRLAGCIRAHLEDDHLRLLYTLLSASKVVVDKLENRHAFTLRDVMDKLLEVQQQEQRAGPSGSTEAQEHAHTSAAGVHTDDDGRSTSAAQPAEHSAPVARIPLVSLLQYDPHSLVSVNDMLEEFDEAAKKWCALFGMDSISPKLELLTAGLLNQSCKLWRNLLHGCVVHNGHM